jgi:hypothetical protein
VASRKLVNRITTFTTGVALGLSILSGPASAEPAIPSDPSVTGVESEAPPADDVAPVVVEPQVASTPPAEEAAASVVADPSVPTTPPAVADDPVAPPAPLVDDSQVVATDARPTEATPTNLSPVRGIPAPPVVALAPGNWGISARVVGVRKAPRLLSVDSKPAPQVLGVRLTREDTLPVTGVDTGLLTMIAAALLVVGTVLVRQGRAPAPAGTVRSS